MNYYRIKSKDDSQYGNCLYFAKLYEERFFKTGKRNKFNTVTLDDEHSKVRIKDDIEYSFTDDCYLSLLDDLKAYRESLWETLK